MTAELGVLPAPPRARSALLAVAGRIAVLGLIALLLATISVPWRPTTMCTLRALTGIPCPLCGTTTAVVAVGRGDLQAAGAASPVALLLFATLALSPLRALAARRPHLPTRTALWVVIGLAALSEAWQLARFGLL